MNLASFLRGLPTRLLEIEEDMFRDTKLKLAPSELDALADLALEGAMARRARGEEVTPAMVRALVRLQRATEDGADEAPPAEPPARGPA